jgi:hypothetical protein
MFELIDADATAAPEPVSDWLGKRLITNAIALEERGWSGAYVWSSQVRNSTGATLIDAARSVVSTHPDYYYEVPFIVPPIVSQDEIRLQLSYVCAGSVDVALWVEGRAGSTVTLTDTAGAVATVALSLSIPAATTWSRGALLIRSVLGASEATGVVTRISSAGVSTNTSVVTGSNARAFHRALVLSGTTGDAAGFALPQTYHAIRARSGDEFWTWPEVDRTITVRADSPTGVNVDVRLIGTLRIAALQLYSASGAGRNLPSIRDTDGGIEPVRAETLARVNRATTNVYASAPQIPWLGGVGGVTRSTPGGAITGLWWGATVRNQGTLAFCQTQVRARDGVTGIVVGILYQSTTDAELIVGIGPDSETITLPGTSPEERDRPESSGTMSWRHRSFTRDQCSAQDAGFHGAAASGFRGDANRSALVIQEIRFDTAPTPGALVDVEVSISAAGRAQVYVAAVIVAELISVDAAAGLPLVGPPPLLAYQQIEPAPAAALAARQLETWETRVRVAYSEWGDPLSSFASLASVTTTVAALSWRTSPDLPAGTVLRLTSDAEDVTLTLVVGAGSDASVHGARGVLTADVAVASDTLYSIRIDQTSTAGVVYALRIEEITP